MNFMVLNTGRAASRAFYLNIRNQSSLVTMSRLQLDKAVHSFVQNRDSGELKNISKSYKAFAGLKEGGRQAGLVFHSVRRFLNFPFDDRRNRKVLKLLRDALEIEVIYFPVRNPDEVFLSQLNRRLAHAVGNWAFPENSSGWKREFTFKDIAARTRNRQIPVSPNIKFKGNVTEMAESISDRTGKIHSLYELFASVFDEVVLLDYKKFIDRPTDTFAAIARKTGASFDNTDLMETRLNSATNRFLLTNPFRIKAFGETINYRIELKSVIPLCDDWGYHLCLPIPRSEALETLEREMGGEIALGVRSRELLRLPTMERQMLTDPVFVEDIMSALLPIFVANFQATKAY